MAANPYQSIERRAPGTIGWRIHYFEQAGSTQDVAAKLAAAGADHGTVVIAETQGAGRGRMGRRWHSPAGANLYATTILRPKIPIAEVATISLVAGVAAAEALETVAPGIVALKWPNDVWLSGKKAGGIISEAVSDADQRLACVLLGIGLNLNLSADQLPDDLRDRATSVLIATGKRCDRPALAAALFANLDRRYTEFESTGFDSIRAAWERYSALTGKRVTVINGDTRKSGIVRGIDSHGALILDTGGELKHILAGDVTLEGAYETGG
jgi:BirA family transcriptional regulator, biotin operon repressor / biotin---[acetyl-CoA-carboxylase] ligase